MKKRLLRYFVDKLYDSYHAHVNKSKYFWYRYWIEKFQDKEENYQLISRFAHAVNLISDSHIQYQLSHIINDYFVCDETLYVVIRKIDYEDFWQHIGNLCHLNHISVRFVEDRWSGQYEMFQHIIFNSLVVH